MDDDRTKHIVPSCAENYYGDKDRKEELEFKADDKSYLSSFLEKLAENKSLLNFSTYYYDDVVKMLETGKKRTTPYVFSLDAFMLDPKNLAHREEIIKKQVSRMY